MKYLKKIGYVFLFLLSFNTFAEEVDMDTFKTKNGKEVKFTFFKHGSMMIDYNGQIIQIDPVSEYADYTDRRYPKADIVLVTHAHSDHLDKKALDIVQKDTTKILLNEDSEKMLGKGTIMKNGDKIKLSRSLEVEAVPAYNITPDKLKYHPKGNGNGYILDMDGFRVYIAGDTEDIPEMKNFKNINVAFIPVNQPYTMTPKQAANAARMIGAPVVYPYHYSDTKIEDLVDLLKKDKNIDVRIRDMQ